MTKYDVLARSTIIADASAYVVLLQEECGQQKVVMFASRPYAQIEKEALALAWAAEKFSKLVLDKKIKIFTDHKPLVPLLNGKSLDSIPVRIQRFKMRLMKFDYCVEHLPDR